MMNKFIYISTICLGLLVTNCKRKNPNIPRVDKKTNQTVCPICQPCPPDPCSEDEKQNPWNTQCYYANKAAFDQALLPPRDFGNGLYFFPNEAQFFAKSLAMFLKSHSDWRITTMAEDSTSNRKGYFVLFEPKTNDDKKGEEK